MNKPKILILTHYMELGGAEASLIGLLHALDPDRIDIDLFINKHGGPMMKYIPDYVNVIPENKENSLIWEPVKRIVKEREFSILIGRLYGSLKHIIHAKTHKRKIGALGDESGFQYLMNGVIRFIPKINYNKTYDLCISFLTPHNIGLEKVKAKKRIAWIHTDYSSVYVNKKMELPIWGKFDNIIAISQDVKKSFETQFPSLKSKIILIENIISSDLIYIRSNERISEWEEFKNQLKNEGYLILLSVGRLSYAKNYDNIPDIARRLVERGLKFKWFIIGYGPEEALIKLKIKEAGMENHVILLGKRENPYPYIKDCDFYVHPSRYEGKSITVREAQILWKPVIITNYPTSSSQLSDRVDGVIVPLDNKECARAIHDFIKDDSCINYIINNLNANDYTESSEVNKIYSLLSC